MTVFVQEIKNAARGVVASPGFSALVIGVLGVGLACVLFVMVIIDGMLLRPLPFADASRLYHAGPVAVGAYSQLQDLPAGDLVELRRRYADSAAVAGYMDTTINLSDLDRPERYDGTFVTANLWRVLGVHPLLGRNFVDADERPGASSSVMLSWYLWHNRYNADPAIVGRQVRVNATLATVIGVMPKDFSFPFRTAVWQTLPLQDDRANAGAMSYTVVLRAARGVTEAALQTTLQDWLADSMRANPDKFRGMRVGIESLRNNFVSKQVRAVLGTMLVAVLLVLLVACANTANLLLTRTLGRRQELAVRAALGASRVRLAQHLLAQSLLLTLLACTIAVPSAWAASAWVTAMFHASTQGPPHWMRFDLDARLIAAAFAAAILTALLIGLLPALRAGSAASAADLRDGTRSVAGGAFARVSRWLVVGEIALSCILLVSAGGLARGIGCLDHYNLGTATSRRLTARVALFEAAYPTGAAQTRYFAQLITKLRSDPGVVEATASSSLPGFGNQSIDEIAPAGATPNDAALPAVNTMSVDDHFLAESGIALQSGRAFDSRDHADTAPVAIVDARFAARFGNGASVLDRRFRLDPRDPKDASVTIIGVVPDLFLGGVGEPARPALLRPFAQDPSRLANLIVHTRGDAAAFAPRLTVLMRTLDADTPAYWVQSYAAAISASMYATRVVAALFSAFGILALILAAAGVYGVISHGVGQRIREIGVRRALGASTGSVLATVLTRSGAQIAIGLGLGLALGIPFAAIAAHPMISEGFVAADPLVIGGVVLVLALSALFAALMPARRALRVDPMVALRHE